MKEEVMQILKMVEEGKITADQAAQLMEAGNLSDNNNSNSTALSSNARWLKVRVYDKETNKKKVNVNVPLSLVSIGLKLGMKFSPHMEELNGVDINEIVEMIKSGAEGKIVDVVDEESGEKVEVYVE